MKTLFLLATIALMMASCGETAVNPKQEVAEEELESLNDQFDQQLADQLGADDYGMKRYVMAFLKIGPNRDQDSATAAQLQRAHMDNIKRLADDKKLIVAGPFLDTGDLRGIFIFNVETIEEAEALTNTDPAIKAGRLVMELHLWYGSAALIQSAEIHKKVAKNEI